MKKRRTNGWRLPHEKVYTRLRPSKIHEGGVGVFAIARIAKGTHLFSGDNEEMVWVPERKVAATPNEIRRLYRDFAVLKNGAYGAPLNFNRLTMAWYLNEPKAGEKPNVRCDPETYEFFALRDIRPGEELTVDYSGYSEAPPLAQPRAKKHQDKAGAAA